MVLSDLNLKRPPSTSRLFETWAHDEVMSITQIHGGVKLNRPLFDMSQAQVLGDN
jgi:hypothetical protein